MIWRFKNLVSGASFWAGLGFVFVVLQRVFQMGVNRERNKQLNQKLHAHEMRALNDQKVDGYSSDGARAELSKWVRK